MDSTIIAGLIGAGGAILATILAWMLNSFRFSLGGVRRRRYSWISIEKGIQKMVTKFHGENLSNVVILSVPGSGSIIAGLFKKAIEKSTKYRYPYYCFLLESKIAPWNEAPPKHVKIETARFNLYIPDAVLLLPKDTTIFLVDSIWVTGDTVAKLRDCLKESGYTNFRVYYLMTIKSHVPGNTPPDFTSYESFNSDLMFPWGKAS